MGCYVCNVCLIGMLLLMKLMILCEMLSLIVLIVVYVMFWCDMGGVGLSYVLVSVILLMFGLLVSGFGCRIM